AAPAAALAWAGKDPISALAFGPGKARRMGRNASAPPRRLSTSDSITSVYTSPMPTASADWRNSMATTRPSPAYMLMMSQPEPSALSTSTEPGHEDVLPSMGARTELADRPLAR